MCRANVEDQAAAAVGALLRDLANALADQYSVDAAAVIVGPVDLGDDVAPLYPPYRD